MQSPEGKAYVPSQGQNTEILQVHGKVRISFQVLSLSLISQVCRKVGNSFQVVSLSLSLPL